MIDGHPLKTVVVGMWDAISSYYKIFMEFVNYHDHYHFIIIGGQTVIELYIKKNNLFVSTWKV